MACAAARKNQVISTKGMVKELTRQGAITRFSPSRTHTVEAAQSSIASQQRGVGRRKVMKAHPTRMPLNPHSPCRPSSGFRPSRAPVPVETTRPATAPQATAIRPSIQAPQKIPARKSSEVQTLF